MVENVSLRSNVAGTQDVGDIKGLEHTEALRQLSGGLDKLEGALGKSQKSLDAMKRQLQYYENTANSMNNKLRNASGWDKFLGRDNNWRNVRNQSNSMASALRGQISALERDIGNIKADIKSVKGGIKAVETASANELAEKTKALKEALKAGDLSGAIMLVLGDKAQGLKGQVDRKMAEIDERNKQSVAIDKKIAKLNPKDEKDAKKIKELEADQNDLNSMNQTDMIRMQTTLNRYNQTNEMMSNLIQKLSRAMDGIISNMK